MTMVIVDRLPMRTKSWQRAEKRTTSLAIIAGLSACFSFTVHNFGQSPAKLGYEAAQTQYENGHFAEATETALQTIRKLSVKPKSSTTLPLLEIVANSQMSLEKYDSASETIERSQLMASTPTEKARVQLRSALLSRLRRNYGLALQQARVGYSLAPNDRSIEGEYYYTLGRIFFGQGFDVAAIVWLEKARDIFELDRYNPLLFDSYRFLSLAWSSKLNYQQSLEYANKWAASTSKSRHKYKHRQALYNLAVLLSTTGQKGRSLEMAELGLKLSQLENHVLQGGEFLSFLLLKALAEGHLARSKEYLRQLEKIDRERDFAFEQLVGRAVIAAYEGQGEASENLFTTLNAMPNSSEFILPTWKIAIAKKSRDWARVLSLNQRLLELNAKHNYRDDLPGIYLDFAIAYYQLAQPDKARYHLEKSLRHIEEIRYSENSSLSLSLFETFHDAYRLLVHLKFDNPQEAFELTDFLKGRLLKDRINNSIRRSRTDLSLSVRQKIEELSRDFINDSKLVAAMDQAEKMITVAVPALHLERPDLSELERISPLDGAAVVSFFFTLDHRLIAFTWEKGRPVRSVYLPISEDDLRMVAENTERKIKQRVFFKHDGKALYDILIKPLGLSSKRLIIVPDKYLWKIPFHALSPDGSRYLIEDTTVSYSPSVSVLLDQLRASKPKRKSLRALANPSFNNRYLKFVNDEARGVAVLFGSDPIYNATERDFLRVAKEADIVHLSMHAEIDTDDPLNSFLAFAPADNNDGKLTVEELLDVKLQKQSLIFVASCDTNNVLKGEGLVSLAWGMMGSGATAVVSAQWEANDRATKVFTGHFYRYTRLGMSPAVALQKAAVEMIANKSENYHEPYYWAAFMLNGDFR